MRAGKKGEFFPYETMFVYQLRLAGNRFPNIQRKFQESFGKMAPTGQPLRPRHFLPASLIEHILSQRGKLIFFPQPLWST